MCRWCEAEFGTGSAFSVAVRPAEALAGQWWAGSFEEAEAGGLRAVMEHVRSRFRADGELWAGPVVVLTQRGESGDGFRSFVGIADEAAGGASLQDGAKLTLPPLTYVTAWHGAGDGPVLEHYRGLLHWMQMQNMPRDVGHMLQREEYPIDGDFGSDIDMLLMMPTQAASMPAVGATRFVAS